MITLAEISSFLTYDPDTGHFHWRVKTNARAPAGARAGCQRRDGYRLIGLRGKMILEHRLAWLFVHGAWPTGHLDHIDCDPSNNRIENLREATVSENHRNVRLQKNNSSGFKGVTYHRKSAVFQAQIKLHGRNHYLGSFATAEEAAAARASAQSLHGEFARLA